MLVGDLLSHSNTQCILHTMYFRSMYACRRSVITLKHNAFYTQCILGVCMLVGDLLSHSNTQCILHTVYFRSMYACRRSV